MAWTSTTTRATGFLVTAAVWNAEIVNNMTHLEEVAYATIVADVSVTATSEASPTEVVSSGAITYEAVPHMIEWFCSAVAPGAGNTTIISLWDASTQINRIAEHADDMAPSIGWVRITPTAASHSTLVPVQISESLPIVRPAMPGGGDQGLYSSQRAQAGQVRVRGVAYRLQTRRGHPKC